MKPTEEQQNGVDYAISALTRSMLFVARAGTGKTSLLKMICPELYDLGRKIALFCFNNSVQKELHGKIGQWALVKTSHSFANSILRQKGKFMVPRQRSKDWLQAAMNYQDRLSFKGSRSEDEVAKDRKAIQDLCHFTRVTMTDHTDMAEIWDMASERGISLGAMQEANVETASKFLEIHQNTLSIQGGGEIDFDDMLWLPVLWDLEFPKFDDVLVDEAQDTSALAREIYSRAVGERMIAVGDPYQAIYGFAGADNDSMQKIGEHFNCKEFPLTMNWRCGKNILREAQKIVPDIKWHDGAEDGEVADVGLKYFYDKVEDGDMILCRLNAPLAPPCARLIREGKKAYIKGRDIGRDIIQIVDNCIKLAAKQNITFEEAMTAYGDEEEDRLRARKVKAVVIDALWDKIEVARYYSSQDQTPDEIKMTIQDIFKDDDDGICLSSIHKQKGGEAPTVWILDVKNIRLSRDDMTESDIEQEAHLEYVAKTRAMKRMYYVNIEMDNEMFVNRYPDTETETTTTQEEQPAGFMGACGLMQK